MRRPPEVVQAALYLGLLLGLSGCGISTTHNRRFSLGERR